MSMQSCETKARAGLWSAFKTAFIALVIAGALALSPLPAIAAGSADYTSDDDPKVIINDYKKPQGDYFMQRLGELFSQDLISVIFPELNSDQPGDEGVEGEQGDDPAADPAPVPEVNMSVDEKTGALVISGDSADLLSAAFTIGKTYNFDQGLVSRFSLDASSAKGQAVKLGFYLDDQDAPFATATLKKQRKKNTWEYSKEFSQDITAAAISGEHTISFKVLECQEGKVSFCMKTFEMCQSTVPTVYLDIDESEVPVAEMNASSDHSVECFGNMRIVVPEGYASEYGNSGVGAGVYEMEYIRGRGNSTWGNEKNPYKIKLANKVDLFGMGASKHWCLIANYFDNSQLRNKFTYGLGDEMGMAYTPQSVAVDVVMNGNYYGSYYLSEQVRVESSRVDIRDLSKEKYWNETDENEIDGGYLLAMFPYDKEETRADFATKRGFELLVESPEYEDFTSEAQVNYIKNYMQKAEDALYGKDFCDKDGVSYKEYIDLKSAAMYYWFQEFSMNGDGYISGSSYMYKDHKSKKSDGKLHYGPLWDFDYVAWGSTEYSRLDTTGWRQQNAVWVSRMLEDPEFVAEVQKQWPVFKQTLEAAIADGGMLDQYYATAKTSIDYNFEKYGMTWFNGVAASGWVGAEGTGLTSDEEVARLKQWTAERIAWVDSNIDALQPVPVTVTFLDQSGNVIETRDVIAGREFSDFPEISVRDGYILQGWEYEYNLTFDEYLESIGVTEEALRNALLEFGFTEEEIDEEINALREEGIHDEGMVADSINAVAGLTLTASVIEKEEAVLPGKICTASDSYSLVDYGGYFADGISLAASVTPFDAIGFLKYESDDESVATVDEDGWVEAVDPGDCNITITAFGGATKTVSIHVYSDQEWEDAGFPDASDVMLPESIKVSAGKYNQIVATPWEENGIGDFDAQWTSIDEDICEVDNNGVIHGVKPGKTIVIRVSEGGDIDICKVTVTKATFGVGSTATVKSIKYKVTGYSKGNYTVSAIAPTKRSLTSVSVPSTVKIKGKTFKVTRVGADAFRGMSKLKTVTLGKNIKTVGDRAFMECGKVYKVKFYSKLKPRIGYHAFDGVKSTCKFYVPKSQKAYYVEALPDMAIKTF